MNVFWSFFLTIYAVGLGLALLWLLIDDGDCVKKYFNKRPMYDKLSANDWVIILWILFLWPLSLLYAYFRYGFIPTIKFIYNFFLFGIKFLLYPFKLLFNLFKSNKPKTNKEPFKDKLGKFIVKVFKL